MAYQWEAVVDGKELNTESEIHNTHALQQQMETVEAEATRDPRTRSEGYNHSSCHDYKGMGSGK